MVSDTAMDRPESPRPTPTTPPQPAPAQPAGKISISWDDLSSRKVEQRLKEQAALERNRRAADAVPLSADYDADKSSIWQSTVFTLTIFGLLGGLLAWGGGELLRLRPDPRAEAAALSAAIADVNQSMRDGRFSPAAASAAIQELQFEGRDNPYFVISSDTTLSAEQRKEKLAQANERDKWKDFITNLLSYGLSGVLISVCLAIAEPVMSRNLPGAVINGSIGAVAGLGGGVIVALYSDQIFNAVASFGGATDADPMSPQQILARAVTWGVMGAFLTLASGLAMRNPKRLLIGILGGALGGLVGGALFGHVAHFTDNNMHISRLIPLVAIGVVAGAATGLIETIAKTGWLKVTAGLIAGKQFILYRNPTFIGADPACQVYLFRDPKVGRRHAAIHILPRGGGYEVEDLPLGGITLVNGKRVSKQRLRNGDKLQIGGTVFTFAEKE